MKTKIIQLFLIALTCSFMASCGGANDSNPPPVTEPEPEQEQEPEQEPEAEPESEPEAEPVAFYFGNDLSYVNEMEDCGAVYKDAGSVVDPYEVIANHGGNLVRVRHWNDPYWQALITQPESVAANWKANYSGLEDVTETIRRSKAAGMEVLLDFHFSDIWADPGRQTTPRAWEDDFGDEDAMAAHIYDYVTSVLTGLNDEGLMPELIQIGNESNSGMMTTQNLIIEMNDAGTGLNVSKGGQTNYSDQYVARMYNSAISAVRDISEGMTNAPRIAIHVAGADKTIAFFDKLKSIGVTDIDIAGFSFYYGWEQAPIEEVASMIATLKERHPNLDPLMLETGYLWDEENIDSLGNIIGIADPAYLPVSKQNQLKYLTDLSQAVADAGGIGVVFWEPSWVSTECRTPWGQGSSHEHVAYFDHRDDLNFHIGGQWMEVAKLSETPEAGLATTFRVDMSGQDTSAGVFIRGAFTEDTLQPMLYEGESIYSYTTHIQAAQSGSYHYAIGLKNSTRETVPSECANPEDTLNRLYTVGENGEQLVTAVWASCDAFDPQTAGPTTLTLNVDMTGVDVSGGVYVAGDLNAWTITELTQVGASAIYTISYDLAVGAEGGYYFLNGSDWGDRETVPEECVGYYDADRGFLVEEQSPQVLDLVWGSCQ